MRGRDAPTNINMAANEERLIRVLVVESNPEQRMVTQWLLEQAGRMEVLTAVNGPEGLELALQCEPDVLLLDIMLSGFSGLELLHQYRAGGGRAKTIVTTLSNDPVAWGNAVAEGATIVLRKPIYWPELIQRIRFCADGLTQVCRDILEEMGICPRSEVLEQAARCAGLLGEGRARTLKEVYIEVVGSNQLALNRIEINLRRMIKTAYAENRPAYRALGLGNRDKPPTNTDFLFALAHYARIRL